MAADEELRSLNDVEVRPAVTVAIPAKGVEDSLGECIESVLSQNYQPKEILVVIDPLDQVLSVSNPSVKSIRASAPGIANARNAALVNCRCEIIAYTDGDCRVDRSWLRELVNHFRENDVASVVGSVTLLVDEGVVSIFKHVDIRDRYGCQDSTKATATGLNCAYRTKILREVGGFSSEIYRCEDAEASYRVLELGYKIVHEPNAKVYHVPEKGVLRFLLRQMNNARGMTKAIWLHPMRGFRDKFIPVSVKIQLPLFLFLMTGWSLVIVFAPLIYVFSLLLAVLFFLGAPMALQVYKVSRKLLHFPAALALHLLRGVAWSIGLILGLVDILLVCRGVKICKGS